jgi:hypothetical protein
LAIEADGAAFKALQTGYGAQQAGFAATRGANEHANIARLQAQADLVNGRARSACIAHVGLVNL